jgi:hypothetical protein
MMVAMVAMVVIVTGTSRSSGHAMPIIGRRVAIQRALRHRRSPDHRLAFDLEFADLEIHFPQGFDRMLQAHLAEKRNLELAVLPHVNFLPFASRRFLPSQRSAV